MKVTYLSKIFNSTIKKLPKVSNKTQSKSQLLLSYYGLISPAAAGTYTIMPMLQRSLDKLINVIIDNMSNIDADKVTMPSLGRSSIWKISGRWDTFGGEMFKLIDREQNSLCLQPTHEEEVTSLITSFNSLSSHKLPILLYQVGPKFRNETAPRSGLLRCREFLMKDLYSFDCDKDSAIITYNRVLNQYHNLFQELGLEYMCVEADCGAMGGLLSHEFHISSKIGEDIVFKCDSCGKGYNQELHKTIDNNSNYSCTDPTCPGTLSSHNAIEIGHCFLLGDKYSKAFDLHYFVNNDKKFVMMGCYGIGVTRLLATCVEVLSTDNEIRWPKNIAPYRVAILLQKEGAHDQPSVELTLSLIERLKIKFKQNGWCLSDIIVDDSQVTIGKKLHNANCLGVPWAIVVKNTEVLETIDTYGNNTRYLSLDECVGVVSTDVTNLKQDRVVTL